MAPLVVYLMSTRCASATPWNHRDHLRTRVAPAAAAYAVEGAGHSAAVPLALGGRDRKFKNERLHASFPGLGTRFNRAPCLLTGAPRIVLPLVLSSAAAEKLAPFCLNRVTEKQRGPVSRCSRGPMDTASPS